MFPITSAASSAAQPSSEADLRAEIDNLRARLAQATSNADAPAPAASSLLEDEDYVCPPSVHQLFSQPLVEIHAFSIAERKQYLEHMGVPSLPMLQPSVPGAMLESYYKDKTMPVKTFFQEHLLKHQFQSLDIIKILVFLNTEFQQHGAEFPVDDDTTYGDLLLGALTMARDNHVQLIQQGRQVVLQHMGHKEVANEHRLGSILRDSDLATIQENFKFKQAISGSSHARPTGNRSRFGRGRHSGRRRSSRSRGSGSHSGNAPSGSNAGTDGGSAQPNTSSTSATTTNSTNNRSNGRSNRA